MAGRLKEQPHGGQRARPRSLVGFASEMPLGPTWIMCGVCSYAILTAALGWLHDEKATKLWREEVPITVYDRSMFTFATAFFIDVLTVCFEYKSSRLDMVLLPAFIKGVATLTNVLVRYNWAVIGAGPYGSSGSIVIVQRYICWMHTTPTILLLVKMMSINITKKQVVRAVVCVEVMLITGLAGSLCSGWLAVFWGVMSHLAFLPLLPFLHQGLTEAGCIVNIHAASHIMTLVYYCIMLLWCMFGLIWDLRMLGYLPAYVEEICYVCCDFAAKAMFSSGLMLRNFKGRDNRREGVMRQIQESHRQTLIQELKRVIEQKDAFMSSVSHELRTPLNGIIGISEGLLSGCCGMVNESVRRQIYIVRTSGARLLALINDVMDAAALRQHRLVLKQERLDLRQVVSDVSDLTRSLVDNDVYLKNDVPEGMVVWADSGRFVQVLNNLLGNAAKFTRQGYIRVSAEWYDAQRQWIAVHVTDTGIGIPKQKLATIFLPFEQVDGSISRQYGGFGLGLSITQELVKAHGGELWVKSKEGKGSSFTFTLPSFTGQTKPSAQQAAAPQTPAAVATPVITANSLVAVNGRKQDSTGFSSVESRGDSAQGCGAPYADVQLAEEFTKELPYDAAQLSALASSKPYTATSAAPVRDRRPSNTTVKRDRRPTQFARTGRYQIMSVDDDQVNQTVVDSLLSSTGYEVVMLSSGRQMLEYLDSCEVLPDLILLDVMMPGMSGPEVCDELAKRPVSLPVPIIMVSAHTDEAVVVKGLDSGADDYITKPFRREEFLARIRAKLQLATGEATEQVLADPGDSGEPIVMCVDDDEVNHIVLEGMLQSQQYRYLKARSGAEALQLLDRSVTPHLVLLDASLPDTTGLEVLQQLRSRFSQLALPVVMLTARHNERAIVEALDSGANDYAVKPFRRSELLARIRMHLRSSHRAAAAAEAVAVHVDPVTAALAQAERDLSVDLKELLPAPEHLKTVPLLVAQLTGLDDATAGLSPEQLSVLLGAISDTFDAAVEKYALLKVECTDTCLTVAALLSSSAATSARSSLQHDQVRASREMQRLAFPDGADSTVQVTPLSVLLQQLLQMSQELMNTFGLSGAVQQGGSAQPVDDKQGLAARSIGSAALGSLPVQLPDSCRNALQLHVALHVGELHAGVVGARRPRHRLLGPALQHVKQAVAAAPRNSIVATDAAARQLKALGVRMKPIAAGKIDLVHIKNAAGGDKQLWSLEQHQQASNSSKVQGKGDSHNEASHQPTQSKDTPTVDKCGTAQQEHQQIRDLAPAAAPPTQVDPPIPQQPQPAHAPFSSQQLGSWATLLLQQQQQLIALAAQLGGFHGGTQLSPAGLGLSSLSWPSGLPQYGLPGSPNTAAYSNTSGTAPQRRLSSGDGSASSSEKPAGSNMSTVSSSSAGQQQTPRAWAGLLNSTSHAYGSTVLGGNGYISAAADLAGALGALAGLQLGPVEAQQLQSIQQEIDALQRQMSAVAAGCMASPPNAGRRGAGDVGTPGTVDNCQGNGKLCGRDSSYGHARSPVAVASTAPCSAPDTSVAPDDLQSPAASNAGQLSPRSTSDGGSLPSSRRSSRTPDELVSNTGQPGRRSSLGQLFKRRSRKQQTLPE